MMKKHVYGDEAYYKITWSPLYRYEKYSAGRILPEMAGILCLQERDCPGEGIIFFYGCWRSGCRIGLKNLLDDMISPHPFLRDSIDTEKLYFRYTVIDTCYQDLQDVLYWLTRTYQPPMNDHENFRDSQRYSGISVAENVRPGE